MVQYTYSSQEKPRTLWWSFPRDLPKNALFGIRKNDLKNEKLDYWTLNICLKELDPIIVNKFTLVKK